MQQMYSQVLAMEASSTRWLEPRSLRMMKMVMMMMIICVSHVTSGRPCHMLPRGVRATCYPGQSKAKQRKAKQGKAEERNVKQSGAKQSNARLRRGKTCHMLRKAGRVMMMKMAMMMMLMMMVMMMMRTQTFFFF